MITKYKPQTHRRPQKDDRGQERPAQRRAPQRPASSRGDHRPQRPVPPQGANVPERRPAAKGGQPRLRVFALGGLEEVGRNMMVFEYDREIITVDMGLQFPEEGMPGIDYIIPNVKYFEDKTDWIKGAIITHGHMDHIGAIPHLIGKLGNPPMFTGKLTAGLIRKRCEEHRGLPKLHIQEIDERSRLQLGRHFKVEFLRVNHSIPDAFAIVITTPVGTLVHTGDFKIDYSPVNDKPADLNRIAQLGGRGVLMMLADSTDATHPGYQLSESAIGEEIDRIFEDLKGRIIIGTFASQISRIQKLFDLAKKHNRRILLQGRSMNNNVEIAHNIGYLKFNPKIIMEERELSRLPDDKVIVIGTGAQGESNAFLMRVVNGEHKSVNLKKGDTVIFSSSVIPGNERSIQTLKDMVVRQGARVIHYQMMDVHAGGHAKQEDLKLMMRLMQPKYYMPIEGSHYMLRAHADLAMQVGIPEERVFVADNGQVIDFVRQGNESVGTLTKEKVPTDYVMVDGLGVGDVSNIVLRDRLVMAEDGMIVAITTVDSKTGEPIGNPDIISRGFVYMKENRELIEETRAKVKQLVKDHDPRTPHDDEYLRSKIRNEIGQFLFVKTKRRPMVLPVVIKV